MTPEFEEVRKRIYELNEYCMEKKIPFFGVAAHEYGSDDLRISVGISTVKDQLFQILANVMIKKPELQNIFMNSAITAREVISKQDLTKKQKREN